MTSRRESQLSSRLPIRPIAKYKDGNSRLENGEVSLRDKKRTISTTQGQSSTYKTLEGKEINFKPRSKIASFAQKASRSKSSSALNEQLQSNKLPSSISQNDIPAFEHDTLKNLSKDLSHSRTSSIHNLVSPAQRTPISFDNFVSLDASTPRKEFSRFPSRKDEDFRTRLRRVLASPHQSTTNLSRSKSPGRPKSSFDDRLKDLLVEQVDNNSNDITQRHRAKSQLLGGEASERYHDMPSAPHVRGYPSSSGAIHPHIQEPSSRKSIPRVLAHRKERISRPKSVPEHLANLCPKPEPETNGDTHQRRHIQPPSTSVRRTLFAKAKQLNDPDTADSSRRREGAFPIHDKRLPHLGTMRHRSVPPQKTDDETNEDSNHLNDSDSGINSITRTTIRAHVKPNGTVYHHNKEGTMPPMKQKHSSYRKNEIQHHHNDETIQRQTTQSRILDPSPAPQKTQQGRVITARRIVRVPPQPHASHYQPTPSNGDALILRNEHHSRPTSQLSALRSHFAHLERPISRTSRTHGDDTPDRTQSAMERPRLVDVSTLQRVRHRYQVPKSTAIPKPSQPAKRTEPETLRSKLRIPSKFRLGGGQKETKAKTKEVDPPHPPSVVETNARIIRWLYDAQADMV